MSTFAENLPVTYKRLKIMGEFVSLYNVPQKAMMLLEERITPTKGLALRISPKKNSLKTLSHAEELYHSYCELDEEYQKENAEYTSRISNISM